MSALRAAFFGLVSLILFSCRDDRQSDGPPSGAAAPQTIPVVASRFAATGWPEDAGPVVVLPGPSQSEVRLILPELTDNTLSDTSSFELDSLPNAAVALYSRDQAPAFATIVVGESEETPRGCKTWPTARLESHAGDNWKIGLATGVAQVVPVLAWGPERAADSSDAARDVIAIASSMRADSAFRGIPFAVRFLFRMELSGSRAIVADAIRRINTEANVREEHVLLIAEKKKGEARYLRAYHETQRGREDEVRVPEILGAVLLGDNRRPAVFVSLEYSEGSRVILLERASASQWIARWRSAYAGC